MAKAARSLLIFKRRHPLSDFALLGKANFQSRQSEGDPEFWGFDLNPNGFDGSFRAFLTPVEALSVLAATQHRIALEVLVVSVRIIQRVMEAPAFFAT